MFGAPETGRLETGSMNYQEIITRESGKRGGRPCVRGSRIAVSDVLGWLANGMSEQEILADFPELTREDILACLAFASDDSLDCLEIFTSSDREESDPSP